MRFILGFFFAGLVAIAAPQKQVLTGTVTNTTAEVTVAARMEVTIDGDLITAVLVTEAPLNGNRTLAGRNRDGWCELTSERQDGFVLQIRGVWNAQDFRGTYTATPEQGGVQYGRFVLAVGAETKR